jgi:phosphohistidine swiveling domain-containing protein
VSGRVTPERYVIGRRGAIIEARRATDAPPALDEAQVRRLAGIVREVEGRLDAPLDIEWAYDGADFFVLQARPIVPLTHVNIYSRSLAADMAPGLIKPLMWSTSILDMTRYVFAPLFTALIGRCDFEATQLVKRIHGRVYANVTLFASLLGRAGLPVNLFEAIARDEPAIKPRMRAGPLAVSALARLVPLFLRRGCMEGRAEAFITRHERYLEGLRRQSWNDRDPRDLYDAACALRRSHGETQWFTWTTAVNMSMRRKMLDSFLQRHAPSVDPDHLLAGCTELGSLAPNLRLTEIAAALRAAGTEAVDAAASGNDDFARERLLRMKGGAAVISLFSRFVTQYGHLSASGTDFTVAPWAETPDQLWQAVAREASAAPGEMPRKPRDGAERRRLEGKLGIFRRLVLNHLLASTCSYLVLRDRMSFLMSGDAYETRRIYLALGDAFVRAEALETTDDIFYLEVDEIEELLSGALAADAARERVRARRAELVAAAKVDPEDIIFGEPRPVEAEPVAAGEYLEGIAGSAGVVRGYARVVRDPSEVTDALGPEDLLVVPFMDIGWTPLFRGIGGIVAETGGQLSHSAIVAREYGIPAVVSVGGAMRLIQDGQPLTIDGNRGRVYLSHT